MSKGSRLQGLLLAASLIASASATAGNELAVGLYHLNISYSGSDAEEDVFNGASLFYTASHEDHLATRLGVYQLENDSQDSLTATGLQLDILVGTGLASEGFKIYAGPGYVASYWDVAGENSNNFNMFQLSAGLGYNFKRFAIDATASYRLGNSYSEFASEVKQTSVDADAYAASIMFAYRF